MNTTINLTGCRLHITNTDKFKSTLVSMKFKNDLTRETATLRSLLSMVLLGGTRQLPSIKSLAIHLEDLYGANITSNVSTKGQAQIIHLSSTFVNENYLVSSEALFEQQLNLMKDILFDPNFENGIFSQNIV